MLDGEAQENLRTNKNLGVYKGALYENVVGEALVKAGYKLYYYKREDSTLEQDFFVRTANSLISIEVKAKNGTAKSIRTLIASENMKTSTAASSSPAATSALVITSTHFSISAPSC